MSNYYTDFPFSAVEGQSFFKQALILAAIYPAIGGVLVSGPKGSAKSTLARALANILPLIDGEPCPFITLPLATSLEMLTGTLDLDEVLNSQKVKFSPGLLSKADKGILYVDEVNLLADHLVDQLLDVAASGVNRIERDGISHSHASQFFLIGTMNPDEGELRGQLKDRFGLMVELKNDLSLEQRVNIVKSREAFERDPQQFGAAFSSRQQTLTRRIASARLSLPDITCEDSIRLAIATRCENAGVEGVRADIVMYRAALAHAAWQGQKQVQIEDVDAVENLVLAHRRTRAAKSQNPDNDSGADESSDTDESESRHSRPAPEPAKTPSKAFNRPPPNRDNPDQLEPNKTQSAKPADANLSGINSENRPETASESDWGSMQVPNVMNQLPEINLASPIMLDELQQLLAGPALSQTLKNKPVGTRLSLGKNALSVHNSAEKGLSDGAVSWFATFLNSAKQWPKIDFCYQQPHKTNNLLHLILLDTSASTLLNQLSAKAKACVVEISRKAYEQREKIQIVGFGNNQVESILKPIRAPKRLHNLESLKVAGSTPLRDVCLQAQQIIDRIKRQRDALKVRCYLITDGRSKAQVTDISIEAPMVLIDTEDSQIKRGRGASIAAQLNAHYYLMQSQ